MSLAENAIREVIERHDAFVAWFTDGSDPAVMDTMVRAFSPTMVMIDPDSAAPTRHADLVAMLTGARGKRPADFSIVIAEPEALWADENAALITYIEHQSKGPVRTARRSTALFTRDEAAPNGVVWQHVHETWITKGDIDA